MYFPDNMNFQYFFFSTYPGYFLQALPIALFAGTVCGIIRYRKDRTTPTLRKILCCTFVCYMTGLLCLVAGLDLMGIAWYRLFYSMDPGHTISWLSGVFDLVPDLIYGLRVEMIGNFLMFLPFGLLYPLANPAATWKRTVMTGAAAVLLIELCQPIVGRAFDMNDIILDTLSILISASVFFGIRCVVKHKPHLR